MATCMQHLYMIPEARKSVLEAQCSQENRHENTLVELKKMFAYLLVSNPCSIHLTLVQDSGVELQPMNFWFFLQESERKAYNPRSFCKVYTMDHQPLNTGEQKDMTEFFTDLITKLEEMGPELVSNSLFIKRTFIRVSLSQFYYLFVSESPSQRAFWWSDHKQCGLPGKNSFLFKENMLIFQMYVVCNLGLFFRIVIM